MILIRILQFIDLITRPVYYLLFYFITSKSIPKSNVEVLHMSARTLADKIRNKKFTSEEVVSAFIKRCQEVNPHVNGIIEDRFSCALADAKEVDFYLNKNEATTFELKLKKPLLGVPITIKESCQVKGMKCTMGVKAFANRRSMVNGSAVQLLLDAGAIPIAVTSTPPYCMWMETVNEIIGYTSNPYNLTKTVGGSSGGEAALISSAASVVGLASDAGGSIRLPCSFAGIYGHKPSNGLVPSDEQFALMLNNQLTDMLVVGPVCRYVEDLELLMNILAVQRPWVYNINLLSSITVYYIEQFDNKFLSSDSAVKKKINVAVDYLQNVCNHKVEELPSFIGLDSFFHVFMAEVKKLISEISIEKMNQKGLMNLITKAAQPCLKLLDLENTEEYVFVKQKLKLQLHSLLSNGAVLLLPTYPESVFYKYESLWKSYKCAYTFLFSIFGLPVTTIPAGVDGDNMPVGLQIVGNTNDDMLCISIAEELDLLFGGWIPPYTLF